MRKISLIWILLMLFIISTACCHQSTSSQQADDHTEDPILIFTCPGTELLIQNFQQAQPDINIQTKVVYGSIEKEIERYGEPDILLDFASGSDFADYYKIGMAADITSFYEKDTQFDDRQYFPGITEVGRSNGQLIALPITIQLPYMTIAKEKWENSAFSAMPETCSVMDLLSAMNEELDKAESKEQYLVFGKEYVDMADWLFSMGAIQEMDTELTIDYELFDNLYQIRYCSQSHRAI